MAYQFVVVLWDDAWIDAVEPMTMADVEMRHKPLVVKSFGWLLKESDIGVTLASERYIDNTEHDVFRASTFIPRAMIKSVTPVNLAKKRTKKAPPPPTPMVP
jgi:hypothetical protein